MLRIIIAVMVVVLMMAPVAFAQQGAYEKAADAYMKKNYYKAVQLLKEHVAETPEAKSYYLMGYAVYAIERAGDKQFSPSAQYFTHAYLIDPVFDPASIGFEYK